MLETHQSYIYAKSCIEEKVFAPKYVIKQAHIFFDIYNNKDDIYTINFNRVRQIDNLLKLLKVARGLKAGQTVYDTLSGFQWLMIIASLCVVYRENIQKRRYQTVILEICRKNGKTFIVAVIFLILFFTEPKFSKFYSVAPDGALSREVRNAIREIIQSSPALEGKFKIRRDDILCLLNQNDYMPLNFSTSRLDGKLPNAFLADEVGALPTAYPIEAMRSGQLTILNKIGFIISTKYPTAQNPFEDEVSYAKKVLDGLVHDDKVFALLYEPDKPDNWATDDTVLKQANPLAVDIYEVFEDLLQKRKTALEVESRLENFLTKHCNIIYQGIGTETYIDTKYIKNAFVPSVDFAADKVFIGVDLAQTNDNCAVAIASYDYTTGKIKAKVKAFIPNDRIDEKSAREKINYRTYIKNNNAVACGDNVIDYKVIEDYVIEISKKLSVISLGYDRYNCISSAQKWINSGIDAIELKQHSSVLHPATKWLKEKAESGLLEIEANELLLINFDNARCTEDTNLNKYVNKKRSNGKVDMVVALINALCLLKRDVDYDEQNSWAVMF